MRKVFTTLLMMLCIVGNAVWGQEGSEDLGYTYDEATQTLTITSEDAWVNLYDASCTKTAKIVVIGNNVKTISDMSFENNTNLTEVRGGSNVEAIKGGAFKGCTSLNNLNFPNVTNIGDNSFYGCSSLTKIDFPKAIVVETSAFARCEALISVSLPVATTLMSNAFGACKALTKAEIPNVTKMEWEVFALCSSLTDISLSNVQEIGEYAFNGCKALTNVDLGSLRFIDKGAFDNCTSLTAVHLPESLTSIGEYAFQYCISLNTLSFSEGLTSIGKGAFSACSALTEVVFPESLTVIEDLAFQNCSSLRSITFPENLTTIGDKAFTWCDLITTVELPNKLNSIGSYALYIESLKSIIIPKSVTSIGARFVYNDIESVEFLVTTPPSLTYPDNEESTGMLPIQNEACMIIVPSQEVKDAFATNEVWGQYENIVVKSNHVETKVTYDNITGGSITISYNDKLAASYEVIPVGVKEITVHAEPLIGNKLEGKIKIEESDAVTEVENGGIYTLKGSGAVKISTTFGEKDETDASAAKDSVNNAESIKNEIIEMLTRPTVIAESSAFDTGTDSNVEVKIVSTVIKEETTQAIIKAYTEEVTDGIGFDDYEIKSLDITPMYVTDGGIKEAKVVSGQNVIVAFPYPDNLGKDDFENVAVLHMKSNGEIVAHSVDKGNLNPKETYIELNDVDGFSPFILLYTAKENVDPDPEPDPEPTPTPDPQPNYYNIYVEDCEGVTVELTKAVVREGNSTSFTIEIAEGYNAEGMEVTVKRSLFGYSEIVTPDEDGKYNVSNIWTDIYITVKGVEEENPTGIEDIDGIKVYTKEGSAYVETSQPEEVMIINMSGVVVKHEQQVGAKRYNLPRGIYIIRVADKNYKISI